MEDSLFDVWKTKIPNYNKEFVPLFERISQKGSGNQNKMKTFGKHFEKNYELYIYAFFLGLSRNEKLTSTKKVNFSHHIQHWGNKSPSDYLRKNFSHLQKNMFAALVAETPIDFIALDKGEIEVDEVAKQLINTMEEFTNGGLNLIQEKLEEEPNFHLVPDAFVKLIMNK
jgi:hypothetical protein